MISLRATSPRTPLAWEEVRCPTDLPREIGGLGLLVMPIPEEWGGIGITTVGFVAAMEQIGLADLGGSRLAGSWIPSSWRGISSTLSLTAVPEGALQALKSAWPGPQVHHGVMRSGAPDRGSPSRLLLPEAAGRGLAVGGLEEFGHLVPVDGVVEDEGQPTLVPVVWGRSEAAVLPERVELSRVGEKVQRSAAAIPPAVRRQTVGGEDGEAAPPDAEQRAATRKFGLVRAGEPEADRARAG